MDRLTVGLEWLLNPDHIPLILSIEEGWSKEESLEIEMVKPKGHSDTLDEIEDGSTDTAITESIHLAQDRAKEQNVVGFVGYLHTSGGIMYSKDKNIARPKDSIGKRFQYPGAPGPSGITMAKMMIEADGGTYKKGGIIPVNHSFYHIDALLIDKVDAAILISGNSETLGARNQELNVDYLSLKNCNIPNFYQFILITTPEVLNTNEVKLRKLLKVTQKTIHYINHYLESATEIYLTCTQIDISSQLNKDTVEAVTKCFINDLPMSSDYYDDLQL